MNKESFDLIIDKLHDDAVRVFKGTEQGELLGEKLTRMDEDSVYSIAKYDQDFVIEWVELIMEAAGQQERFVYERGMKDCVGILKQLGVLT